MKWSLDPYAYLYVLSCCAITACLIVEGAKAIRRAYRNWKFRRHRQWLRQFEQRKYP